MPWIVTLLVVVQVISAGAIIILVLLQHGKGADMGAAFGSGASGSLFGASGSANFLSRSTAVIATVFFLATIGWPIVQQRARRPPRRRPDEHHRWPRRPSAPADPGAARPPAPQAAAADRAPGGAGRRAGRYREAGTGRPADKSAAIPK
jgi:preprotein translocase subunit SecG